MFVEGDNSSGVSGFTLMEIMITIVVVAVVASMISTGVTVLKSYKVKASIAQIEAIKTSINDGIIQTINWFENNQKSKNEKYFAFR